MNTAMKLAGAPEPEPVRHNIYQSMLREYPDVMSAEQMSDALGISTKTGCKLLREGKICSLKIGKTYRVPKAHLFAYLHLSGGEQAV
jgi:excisionase family DNA binding protein